MSSMAAPKTTPNATELRKYLSKGLTQQQIADAWFEDSGERVSRSAIAMVIERYGLKSAHPRPTYTDMVPWVVRPEHRWHPDLRMLRLEGRLRNEGPKALSAKELRWLEEWKQELAERGAVVHYEPDLEPGFHWIEREDKHGDDLIDRSNAVKSAS